jgi:mono/diheme cytochrome c family protein
MKRAAFLPLLVACGADVPASPTYFADVQPILRANCARCHGADPDDPKVAAFRLDRYVKNDVATFDVYDYATGTMPVLAEVAIDRASPAMPPDYALTDRQRDILARWIAQGAPKGTRDNHLPQIELVAPTGATMADQSLAATFRAWDDDLDGLVVQLWARDVATNEDLPLGAQTGAGLRTLEIDTGTLASKHMFEIFAILDDGFADDPAQNQTRVTLIPSVLVDHGARGTAPTVRVVSPNGGGTLVGAVAITWTATDPDVDPNTGDPDALTIDLALVRYTADGAEVSATPIASGLSNTGAFAWTIPMSIETRDGAGNPIPYRVRVTATDTFGMPRNVRSDDSDVVFFIEQATTTTYTWADVEPLTVKYCAECHGQPARTIALDTFCLLQYEQGEAVPPCEASDVGVYEMRGTVYTRVVTQKNMPPASEPQPTQAERGLIGNWITGGAPFGSGPSNARPTLVWMTPSTTVLDASTSGTAVLRWTDSDAEELVSDRIEYAKVTGPPSCNLVSGCASVMATWKPLVMNNVTGTSQAQMYSWSVPAEGSGCYCVRGTVTDAAMQSTTVVADKPVRF